MKEAASQFGHTDVDHAALVRELQSRGAQSYATEAISGTVGQSVDPRRCGLPRATVLAVIETVHPPVKVDVQFAGEVSQGQLVATFEADAEVELLLRLPASAAAAFPEWMIADSSDTVIGTYGQAHGTRVLPRQRKAGPIG